MHTDYQTEVDEASVAHISFYNYLMDLMLKRGKKHGLGMDSFHLHENHLVVHDKQFSPGTSIRTAGALKLKANLIYQYFLLWVRQTLNLSLFLTAHINVDLLLCCSSFLVPLATSWL